MKPSLLILALALAWDLQAQAAQQPSLGWLSQSLQRLVRQVGPSVVQISSLGLGGRGDEGGSGRVQTEQGSGSGVILDPDGYIVTNAHVVGSSTRLQVLLPDRGVERKFQSILKPAGKVVDAELVGLDRETDIAVLKVPVSGLPALKLGDSSALVQGELVLAAGSPFGLQNSVTMGVVSSVARQVRPDDPMIYIQTDAAINPGNSGGPLLNAAGEVVGINTFIVSGSGANAGVGFAAPSDIVRNVYEQIRKHGRVRRGQIGLVVQTINPGMAAALQLPTDFGAIVADVVPGGAAAAGGVEVKDIILSLDGKPIENARQFGVNVYQKAHQTVTLEVLRNGEKKTLKVAVLERPKDPDRLMAMVNKSEHTVPSLGLLAMDLDDKVTPLLPTLRRLSGAVIVGVLDEGVTGTDNLRPGDVVYEMNNQPVRNLADLMAGAKQLKPRQPVVLHIERGGQWQFVQLEAY